MRQLQSLAFLATFLVSTSMAQVPKLIANNYTRYGVYAIAGPSNYAPDIVNYDLTGISGHFDPFIAESWDGPYHATTIGTSSYSPAQMKLDVSCAVATRGSASGQVYYRLHVDTATLVEVKAMASFISHVWWDKTVVSLYSNSGYLANFNSDNGTQTGTNQVTLVPGVTYTFYTAVNRNNIYQGGEAFDTDTAVGTLSVLGTRTGTVSDPSFTGNWSTRTLTFQIWQGGVLMETIPNVPITPSGSYSVSAITRGLADVRVRGDHWLYNLLPGVMLDDNILQLPPTVLRNGDVDSSGEVDAADIDQVIAFFGNLGSFDADVDGSREVDAADIDLVILTFGGIDQ